MCIRDSDNIEGKASNDDSTTANESAKDTGETGSQDSLSDTVLEDQDIDVEEEYIPGQDVQVDHAKILDILLDFLSDSSGRCYAGPSLFRDLLIVYRRGDSNDHLTMDRKLLRDMPGRHAKLRPQAVVPSAACIIA